MEKEKEKAYNELFKKINKLEENKLIKIVKGYSNITGQKNKDMLFSVYLIVWIESVLKKVLEETLLDSQKLELKHPKLVSLIFEETTFTAKINIMEGIFRGSKRYKDFKKLFSYCREINNVRNQIFHIKLENLTYKGKSISNTETKRKMLKDLIKARMKMDI